MEKNKYGGIMQKSYWFLYDEIKCCGDCPCNYLDGHQNYCKLSKQFNVDKDKNCPLEIVTECKFIGGTDNDD